MTQFNFAAPAELFPGKNKSKSARYQRFSSAAGAVLFVIEDLLMGLVNGSMIEVNEQRFNSAQIRDLYYSAAYPLTRTLAA